MLFSIIMCTYNSERTLKHALDSVINQTCQDWEIVVLDNGSADKTTEILKEYQKKEQRIVCKFQEHNVGWAKGTSICLSMASGEYMMFLGADDYLFHNKVLEKVQKEILEYQPDIIWTGHVLAEFENDKFRLIRIVTPKYRRYEKEDKQTELVEILRDVYYNSIMHYVKTDFLKENGIDFYSPFYGDCQGMTEALCRAERMTVLDGAEYVLTLNTSQSSSKTVYDYDICRQWESIKSVVPEIMYFRNSMELEFIAKRIFQNLSMMLENIVLGGNLCNKFMNDIQKSLPERFLKAEEWISSNAFGEMMFYAGRKNTSEYMIGAVGVLYWACKKQESLIKEIQKHSKWIADFSEIVFVCGEDGKVSWKNYFSEYEARKILLILDRNENRHLIGAELLLKDEITFENETIKAEIQNRLKEYIMSMQRKA